ncbi:MAG TPA: acyl-CoA dehydrogenase, partial [Alcanivorax sp.]|nr:acyl-CoA dehydrogenase [Alcanivorax sp.]
PAEAVYAEQHGNSDDRWTPPPIIKELKNKAKAEGLWNLFLPESEHGAGLSNYDYAHLCEVMGRSAIAPQIFNCAAPDTGNMEVLARYGTPEQQEQWLKPLLNGEIRSCFSMTEPAVASSDATNICTEIKRDGDDYVINGRKWWSSGAMSSECKIAIVMGKSDPDAPRHQQQSQILVPLDTPGVKIERALHVFGYDHAPKGHAEITFTDVRVPASNLILGEGRGFEIAQGRLGPGRIHHCMRSIGSAEKALDLILERGMNREAFGKQIINLGKNMETVSRARIEIEAMRMIVLKAAKAMDVMGNKEARIWVSMAKAMVPEKCCQIIDQAIQIHGATGVSQWSPLSEMYMQQRTLRLADGPDEVHHNVVARNEVNRYNQTGA